MDGVGLVLQLGQWHHHDELKTDESALLNFEAFLDRLDELRAEFNNRAEVVRTGRDFTSFHRTGMSRDIALVNFPSKLYRKISGNALFFGFVYWPYSMRQQRERSVKKFHRGSTRSYVFRHLHLQPSKSNLTGIGKRGNQVNVIDFGLAKKYRDPFPHPIRYSQGHKACN
ncbi:hypothetical protein VE03_10236 [Pseudogymnoascus sp. 23342-1-I1]|nr:hypothetical protein VE03_10236 [Pseudogymnoascus sp. 23342-1-I1]